jgi:hypothetical protein
MYMMSISFLDTKFCNIQCIINIFLRDFDYLDELLFWLQILASS